MNYISTKEAAEKWKMDFSQVGKLARAGKIQGAKQIGARWMIPERALRPVDGRTKAGKAAKSAPEVQAFRFPNYVDFPVDMYDPPLSEEELELRNVQVLFNECRLQEAADALNNLPEMAENRYVRIAALYFACLISAVFSDKENGYHYLRQFNMEYAQPFPYKEEMLFFLYQLDTALDGSFLLSKKIKMQPQYAYHVSATPFLLVHCTHSSCLSCVGNAKPDLSIFELNCGILERDGFLLEAQVMHLCLGLMWFLQEKREQSIIHIRRVLQIAFEKRFYWVPAMYYLFCSDAYDRIFPEFPKEFSDRITSIGKELFQRYVNFTKVESLNTIAGKLLKKDIQFIFSAIQDFPNKKIAALMNLTETSVSKKYNKIYERLGVNSKKELREYFLESFNPSSLHRR